MVHLSNSTVGHLYHLNYPHAMPNFSNFTQHLVVPLGFIISVELQGVQFGDSSCGGSSSVEVYDKYADKNGTSWILCPYSESMKTSHVSKRESRRDFTPPVIFMTSYLNTIHIKQSSLSSELGLLNATIRVQPDVNYKLKLVSTSDEWVESCSPNPCQYEGKCVASGKGQTCQCKGHFTGRFCGLTMCELDPCVFGQCELTNNGFKVCHI